MQMRTRTLSASPLERALTLARRDGEFRARVIEDGWAARADVGLNDTDWHALLAAVEQIEHTLERDPFAVTQADHGEAEAAGAKG